MTVTRKVLFALFTLSLVLQNVRAEEREGELHYKVEMQASLSTSKTPLWLNANKHGLSSLESSNGYLRAAVERPLQEESEKKLDYAYGLDIAAAYHYTSKFVIQQAFVEGRWLHGTLTIGSKEYPMELKNNQLSSGAQTLGINARPVPQVRLALPDYWEVPLTRGWVSLKGHLAYGRTTDGNWQADFTNRTSKYTSNTWYHSKAGYLKIGNAHRFYPVSLELGLEMAAQFGGKSYNISAEGGRYDEVGNEGGLKAFWHAFIPSGAEAVENKYQNISGNQLGSYVFRLNFDYDTWYLGIYGDHFFEDQSAMFMLDYDGYGEGDEWNVNKKRRYLLYDLKDMMLGVELKLKNCRRLNNIVFEYIYTKYQSGPIYHDHTANISDHIGGVDNYYNHYIFTGWQHWGQVIGNPLYLSPIYNDDGTIEIKDNRFYAFHLGLSGNPSEYLSYRAMLTYQKGFGSYSQPYENPRENISLMAEATYTFPEYTKLKGWSVRLSAGIDNGKMRGYNQGGQITIIKAGTFDIKRKKK